MTSLPSAAVLEFSLQPSRWLRLYVCWFHGALALLAVILPLQFWSSLVLGLAVFVSSLCWLRRFADAPRVTQLRWSSGGWRLLDSGLERGVELRRSWLRPWGVRLDFECNERRGINVTIFRDQLTAQEYRRLRVMVLQAGADHPGVGAL